MNKTIEEMKDAKRQLEQDILKQLQEFERYYGVEVGCVDLDVRQFVGSSPEICGVTVKVGI